ncbi:MAG TPA: PAS domain-containing protein [Terriglobia bacterium]|nr:PAS domain-containing protein [Terriglobia bacterium]
MSAMPSAAGSPLLESPSLTISATPTEGKLLELLAQWQAWPKQDGLPGRDQFEPADMPHLLPHLCLVEYDRHANPYRHYDVLFRYIGTRIGEDFNMSHSTRRHMSDFGASFAQRWYPVFDRVVTTRRPFAVHGVPYLIDKTYLRFELVFLPLMRGDAAMPADASDRGGAPAKVSFALFGGIFGPNLAGPQSDDELAAHMTAGAAPIGGDCDR